MRLGLLRLMVVLCGTSIVWAADINGTIVIERKLTKRRVTAVAPAYQRGAAVDLGEDEIADPLFYERAHVAVYLETDAGGEAPSSTQATLSMGQKERRFVPDMIVVPVGSTVSFPNFDPIFHNVFSLSKAKSFDLGNYPAGQTRTVTFRAPGVVMVNCHLHSNMGATVVVAPSRWAVLADGTGKFVLPGVPPGTYTIVAWHKTAGFFRQKITVGDSSAPRVQFVIPFTGPEPLATAQR